MYTRGGFVEETLHIEDGAVRAVGGDVPAGSSEIDARGLLVLPGAIDAHVHGRDPGFPEKETFDTLTAAAAAGGVTTVLDMPNNVPAVDSVEAFEAKLAAIGRKARVDFGLFALIRSTTTPETIQALAGAGAVGFKAYLGYAWKRSTRQVLYTPDLDDPDLEPPPDHRTIASLHDAIAATGLPLVVHCEDPQYLAPREAVEQYSDLLRARPDAAEASAVAALNGLARLQRASFHVAHLSSAKGATEATRYRGPNFTTEVTPNHLWRSESDYAEVGNLLKMFPPVRMAEDQLALRDALWRGDIQVVATDHAPHTDAEKLQRSLAAAAPGSPGVQTLLVSSLELARQLGDVSRAVPWVTENPAGIFHLPRKGSFEPGADADLVLVDPAAATDVRPEEMESKQKHSALQGLRFGFRVRQVFLRGEPAGEPGRGRLVRPARKAG